MKAKKAQTLAEYAIIAGIIAIVLVTMGTPFKRTVQKIIKSTADAIGFQGESEQAAEPDKGYLNSAKTDISTKSTTSIDEDQGSYTSVVEETSAMKSESLTNMGFSEYAD